MRLWHQVLGHQIAVVVLAGVTHHTCNCGKRWLP